MIASAVLCTRNRYQEVLRCLKSLACQTRPVEQVIIVDAAGDLAGTGGTLEGFLFFRRRAS